MAENPNADAADADADTEAENPLTHAVAQAKSGLRRDVAALLEALDAAELLVPISKQPANARDGEQMELDGELTLSPHLLPDASGEPFAALSPTQRRSIRSSRRSDGRPMASSSRFAACPRGSPSRWRAKCCVIHACAAW